MKKKSSTLLDVLQQVAEERARQDLKFGLQNHRYPKWLAILMEEVGETSRAFLDEGGTSLNLRDELIQVAAVAVAMVQRFDRGGL